MGSTSPDAPPPETEPPEPFDVDSLPTPVDDPTDADPGQLVKYNDTHRQIIREVIGDGKLTDAELDMVVYYGERLGLDVITRQIHAWKDHKGKLIVMVGIDGMRATARRTGDYAGRRGPQWLTKDREWVDVWVDTEPPLAARVWVKNRTDDEWTSGIATWAEYAQYTMKWVGQGNKRVQRRALRKMWNLEEGGKPWHMLAKCAEAIALRAAFPADLSGVYTTDEINTAEQLLAEQVNPDARPGAGSDQAKQVAEIMATLLELDPETAAIVDDWWSSKYVPGAMRLDSDQVPGLAQGGAEVLDPEGEHMAKVLDLISKALASVQAGANEPSGETPAEPDASEPEPEPQAEPTPPPTPVDEVDPNPFTTAGWPNDQAYVLAALRTLDGHAGRVSDIAAALSMNVSHSLRTTVAVMAEQDWITPDDQKANQQVAVWSINTALVDQRLTAQPDTPDEKDEEE